MALYLITGGCGFIGSHLAEDLLAQGHRVRIIDNLSTGKVSNLPARETPKQCEIVIGDVTDKTMLDQCFEGVDYCFHLAAIASVQLSNEDWAGTHQVNLTGSINVFNAARRNQIPVVYASSAAVYGDNAESPLTESAVLRPLTAYGADKLGSELHARVASFVHSVPTTGLRFFNVFGPKQDSSSPYSGVISIFAEKVLQQESLSIYGDGDQVRDFIYVKDVVQYLLAAMNRVSLTPSVFNVCTGRSTTINQLARTMMSVADKHVGIKYLPARTGDIRVSIGAPGLSERLLRYRAHESLASGLKKLIDYEFGSEVSNMGTMKRPRLGMVHLASAT
jgi:UDP-glucose 4-epimerase